jgi:hypothetical protein
MPAASDNEAGLPAVEPTCSRTTGNGCTLIPQTDAGDPAQFYPFFTNANVRGTCNWQFGNDIPGNISNFGRNDQYGSLLPLTYLKVRWWWQHRRPVQQLPQHHRQPVLDRRSQPVSISTRLIPLNGSTRTIQGRPSARYTADEGLWLAPLSIRGALAARESASNAAWTMSDQTCSRHS